VPDVIKKPLSLTGMADSTHSSVTFVRTLALWNAFSRHKLQATMDTKTLVIGQDVYLNAGAYGLDGKVVKIRWSHAVWRLFGLNRRVYVQPYRGLHDRIPPWQSDYFRPRLLRFDNEGKECGGNPLFEGGPWYIDGVSTKRQVSARETSTR
jgi:hypothetical protein